ncbi:unnamed protein product, partial [Rotaria magnacalcarata]
MHGKLYVLLAILFVVTIASVYADGITKKNDAPTSTKKNKGNDQDKESGESEESTAQYSIFRPDNRKHIHVQFPSEQPQLSFPVPTSSN